jgi:hypothetical protein
MARYTNFKKKQDKMLMEHFGTLKNSRLFSETWRKTEYFAIKNAPFAAGSGNKFEFMKLPLMLFF